MATERVPGALSVATGVWVGVGSRDEPAELSGVSHFLEHLLFKGTADALGAGDLALRRSRRRRHQRVHRQGVHGVLLPAAAPPRGDRARAARRRADRARARDEDVESERQVILEELAMDDDAPDDVAQRTLARQLFPDHALGRETAGERDTVQAITADDVRAFFDRALPHRHDGRPLAGDVDHDEMLAQVATAFAGMPDGDGRVRRAPSPAIAEDDVDIDDDTEQVHLVIGGRAIARDDPDREALDVVNHVFGGGLSSRLFEEIRERRGLAYSVYSARRRTPTPGRGRCTPARSPSTPTRSGGSSRGSSTGSSPTASPTTSSTSPRLPHGRVRARPGGHRRPDGAPRRRCSSRSGEVSPVAEQVARWERGHHADVRRVHRPRVRRAAGDGAGRSHVLIVDRVGAAPAEPDRVSARFGRMIKVGVVGAADGWARRSAAAVALDPDLELVAARRPVRGRAAGSRTSRSRGEPRAFADAGCDVVVDFTVGRGGPAHGAVAGHARHPRRRRHDRASATPTSTRCATSSPGGRPNCVVASNFAICAVLMMRFAELAAPYFDTAEIIELHHDRKVDAPSGTALRTAERMAAASDRLERGPDHPRGRARAPAAASARPASASTPCGCAAWSPTRRSSSARSGRR